METLGASGDMSEDAPKVTGGTDQESEYKNWSRWPTSVSEGRIFARTERGYYVLGPAALEPGDVVCLLFGSKVPFYLRRASCRVIVEKCLTIVRKVDFA